VYEKSLAGIRSASSVMTDDKHKINPIT